MKDQEPKPKPEYTRAQIEDMTHDAIISESFVKLFEHDKESKLYKYHHERFLFLRGEVMRYLKTHPLDISPRNS